MARHMQSILKVIDASLYSAMELALPLLAEYPPVSQDNMEKVLQELEGMIRSMLTKDGDGGTIAGLSAIERAMRARLNEFKRSR